MDLELEGDEIGASDKRTRGREDRLAMSKKCYMSILALDVQVMIALIPSMPYELAIASSLACSCVLKLISMSNQAVLVHGLLKAQRRQKIAPWPLKLHFCSTFVYHISSR